MILLDTNVVSELMKGQPDPRVRDWLDRRTGDGLFVSAITQAEIGLGIALLPDGKRREALALAAAAMFTEELAGVNLSFDPGAAAHYAALVAYRTRMGRPISTEDAQIAAIALNHGMALATRNLRASKKSRGSHCSHHGRRHETANRAEARCGGGLPHAYWQHHVRVTKRFQYRFAWDPGKARRDLKDHEVAFERAATVFLDPKALSAFDGDHSEDEDRWLTLGVDRTGTLLVVSHTYLEETEASATIRLISARKATKNETKQYTRK